MAHLAGDIDAHILDLAVYEVGNVLVRALGWPPEDVAEQLDDLLAVAALTELPGSHERGDRMIAPPRPL